MPEPRNCSTCYRPIPADAPQGVCPNCLFGLLQSSAGRETDARESLGVEPLPDPAALAQSFPQLEILERIGAGGMGTVYRVKQRHLDRPAALKVLNPRLANEPGFQERFAREARLMARLVHPNIALVFEFGTCGEFNYLLMELIEGVNLRSAIRNKTISPQQALEIVPQLCDALQYAHEQGVIHRDIKPENILIDRGGRVKLVDFGLAKLNRDLREPFSLTGSQQIMGTMNYMAPEVWERQGPIDHRADIFSLGVVFYELLTGELPLGRFAPPSERANVDQRLDSIVLRTLAKDPQARYQSAGEIKTAVGISANDRLGLPAGHVHLASESREFVAGIPIQLGDNVNNWETTGMVSLFSDRVRLEYSRKDNWFGTDRGIREIAIPLRDIARVRRVNGPLTKGLEIHTKTLSSLKDFPYVSGRGVFIYIKRSDIGLRDRLYQELTQLIGQPAEAAHETELEIENTRRRIRGPANGLILSGIFDLLAAAGGLVIVFLSLANGERSVFQILMGIGIVWHALLGLFLMFAAGRQLVLRNFGLGMTAFIAGLVPLHAGWLVGLPSGIWGLIALTNPSAYSAYEAVRDPTSPILEPGKKPL